MWVFIQVNVIDEAKASQRRSRMGAVYYLSPEAGHLLHQPAVSVTRRN